MSKPDANFIWSIANLLRGPYKPKEYGGVVPPDDHLATTRLRPGSHKEAGAQGVARLA